MSSSIAIGSVAGVYRLNNCPFLSIKNFSKFHLISGPSSPLCFSFRYLYKGIAESPLTLICNQK